MKKLAMILIGMVAFNALACRFNVRDVGFVDLGSAPYRLFVFLPDATTKAERESLQSIAYATYLDSNVKAEMVACFFDEAPAESDFVKRVKRVRAQQDELARVIAQLPNVIAARVHAVIPEPEDKRNPTATVLMQMKNQGDLDAKLARTIRLIVSKGFKGMVPANVSVTDNFGNFIPSPVEHNAGLPQKKNCALKHF